MFFGNRIGQYAHPAAIRHDFYITDDIGDASEYHDLLQTLAMATETDVVYIHLNTPGGDFYTTCQICDAILNSKAGAVVGCAEGQICSGGTMIFLACNGWHVSDLSTFMFHTSSGGQVGKMPDTMKQARAHEEHLNRVCGILYSPFFNDDELDDIINGNQDAWLCPDEVTERLQAMTKILEDEQTDLKKSIEDAAECAMAEEEQSIIDNLVEEQVKTRLSIELELHANGNPSLLDSLGED